MALRTSDLLLPEGFVEMDCEEMMYVDGGGIARSTFALCLDITIVAISFVCTVVGAAVTYFNFAKINKGLIGNILKKQAKDTLKKMIKEAGKSLGITLISATIGAVDALAGILFDFSIGYAIAHLVDWADGNYNGICFG